MSPSTPFAPEFSPTASLSPSTYRRVPIDVIQHEQEKAVAATNPPPSPTQG